MTAPQKQHIDAIGMRCPRPIVELAKARRHAAPASLIEIEADDLAFESDVKAWCETTGSTLVELVRENDRVRALIRIEEGSAS